MMPVRSNSTENNTSPSFAVLMALLFTWVLVVPMSTLPFQAGKALALVGWALLALWEYLCGSAPPSSSRVRVLGVAAVIVAFLSTWASVAPRVALWGNDDRYMGVLVWGAAGALGYAWWAGGGNPRLLGRVLALGTGIAGGMLLWARVMPPPPNTFLGSLVPGLQAGGTLGNESFLGVAMMASAAYFVGLAWASRRSRSGSLLWWGMAVWNVTLPLVIGSRAALLGLWTVVLFLGWFALRKRRGVSLVWWGVGAGAPIGALAWALTHPYGRLWSLLHRNGTLMQRLLVWQATLRLFARTPWRVLTGFGADTLGVVFPHVYPAVLIGYEPDRQAHVFDRAHNLFLDVGIQFGIGGLFLLLVGCVLLLRTAWRRMSYRPNPVEMGALAAVLALLVMWQFHFPTPTSLLLAALFTATALGASRQTPEKAEELTFLSGVALALLTGFSLPYGGPWGRPLLLGAALALVGFLWGHGNRDGLYVLFLPSVLAAALWMLFPARWVFMPVLAVWGVALLGWGWFRCRGGEEGLRGRALWVGGLVLLSLGYMVMRPLVADSLHQAARVWGGDKEVMGLAEEYGTWAWRLDGRERVALTLAQLALVRHRPPTQGDVATARHWLDRAPRPHTAAWWYVTLQVMGEGRSVGAVSEAELREAYEAALEYFPGNVLWQVRGSK